MAFFRADDDEAAYKQLPLEAEHAKLTIIAHRSHLDKHRYGFVSRAVIFGAVAAALRYNFSSRAISEIFTNLPGIAFLVFRRLWWYCSGCFIRDIDSNLQSVAPHLGAKLEVAKS